MINMIVSGASLTLLGIYLMSERSGYFGVWLFGIIRGMFDTEGEFFVVRMRGYLSGAAASNNNKDRFEYGRLLFNEGRSSSNNELMQAGVYLLSQAARGRVRRSSR